MLVSGFMKGLETDNIYESSAVKIKILDDNGKLVETKLYKDNKLQNDKFIPSLYEVNVFPRNNDGYALSQDILVDGLDRLRPNEFRTSFSITPLDFIENKMYTITAEYGENKIHTEFEVYDKFAHMTDVFEIYHNENIQYEIGDTITVTGLAPYAVGGVGSSNNIVGFNEDGTSIRERSSSVGDNQHVIFTVKHPCGDDIKDQISVENGEFSFSYDIPDRDRCVGDYTVIAEWSNNYNEINIKVN